MNGDKAEVVLRGMPERAGFNLVSREMEEKHTATPPKRRQSETPRPLVDQGEDLPAQTLRTTANSDIVSLFGADMARRRGQRKGYLRKMSGSWLLEYREDALDKNGQPTRVRKYRTIAPAEGPNAISKREAQRRAWDEVLSGLDRRNINPSSLMTVEDFVRTKFEPQVVWKKKPGGKKHYSYLLRKLIWSCQNCGRLLRSYPAPTGKKIKDKEYCGCGACQSLIANRRLCDVSQDEVERITAHLHRKGYGGQSVKHFRNCISAIFRHAKRLRLYPYENPARDVDLPEVRPTQRPTYTWEQCQLALRALPSPYREMCLTSVTTSLNVAELCGLRQKHCNLTDQIATLDGEVMAPYTLAVRKNFYEGERGSLKTGARCRNVPIDRKLGEALARLVAQSKFQGPEYPLFSSRNGTPVDAHNVSNRHFRPLSVKLGFPVTWHAFRRAHSSFAGELDLPLADRAATMGHRDARMTLYYDVQSMERRRAVPEQIMERLEPTSKTPPKPPANVIQMPVKKGA
jgi:site-specific recombinase XerC